MARTMDAIGGLWDAVTAGIAGGEGDGQVGFCLDTCHANSAWLDLADVVDKIKAINGLIYLVHCNNSRDPFGSSRDRHANLTDGTIDPELILGVVRAAGAPAVCETPDTDGSLAGGGRWLKDHLAPRRPRPPRAGPPGPQAARAPPGRQPQHEPVRRPGQPAPRRIVLAVPPDHVVVRPQDVV